jgi:hypothetical protein
MEKAGGKPTCFHFCLQLFFDTMATGWSSAKKEAAKQPLKRTWRRTSHHIICFQLYEVLKVNKHKTQISDVAGAKNES